MVDVELVLEGGDFGNKLFLRNKNDPIYPPPQREAEEFPEQ